MIKLKLAKRKQADVVFSGSGTLLDALCGAGSCLEDDLAITIRRVCGISGGSMNACARAYGWSWEETKKLGAEALTSGKLLDLSFTPWDRWGFFKGDYIYDLLKHNFPKTMGESEIPWCCYAVDLWSGETVEFSSVTTPDVPASLAVRASMAIPVFFKGVNWRDRFLVDGGMAVNFAMDAFDDDDSVPTIGVRFRALGRKGKTRVDVKELDLLWPPRLIRKASQYAEHLLEVFIENGNKAHLSAKNWQREIRIDAGDESGMDFFQNRADVDKRWQLGYKTIIENRRALEALFKQR
jgi:NTE family protein